LLGGDGQAAGKLGGANNSANAQNANLQKGGAEQRKRELESGVGQLQQSDSGQSQGMQAGEAPEELGKRQDSRSKVSSKSLVQRKKDDVKNSKDPSARLAGVKASHRSSARGKGAGIRA